MSDHPNFAQVVVPSDTVLLPKPTDWLSFNNSGSQTLTIETRSGQVALGILPSGMYPIRATQVFATGTSVTNIVAWWI